HYYRGRSVKYPGIKEDVYVSQFAPTPGIRSQLNVREEEILVTVRPPATEAHYHASQSDDLFEAAVKFLDARGELKLIVLPRNEKQEIDIRNRWPDLFQSGKMRIPHRVVDGLNLIWHSDLVISGGGTMNREAAALGVPVYSIFRGRIGAVDQYLSRMGRLVLLESSDEFPTKVSLVRRDRSVKPRGGNSAALRFIVNRIVATVESTRVARSQAEQVPVAR